ncbi:MAG: response regulator [Burkholderiales bacterium]|nr:response regulator [Burkholderiales bacterium]
MAESIYRRTELGERAMRGQAGQIAPELIRVLALVSGDTHFDLIKRRAIRMPEGDLRAALDRLKSGGFLSEHNSGQEHDLDFTAHFDKPLSATDLSEEDKRRIAMAATDGHDVLTKTGSFLQLSPAAAMTPLGKAWTDITILIIEDDEIQARFAQNIVMKAGFKQRHAATREEIIAELNKTPLPDCVLLDVELPGTNGFDILARMRAHPRLKPVPVVMLTAMASQQDVFKGLSLGATAYVAKPYKKQTLVDTIVKAMGLKAGGQ